AAASNFFVEEAKGDHIQPHASISRWDDRSKIALRGHFLDQIRRGAFLLIVAVRNWHDFRLHKCSELRLACLLLRRKLHIHVVLPGYPLCYLDCLRQYSLSFL